MQIKKSAVWGTKTWLFELSSHQKKKKLLMESCSFRQSHGSQTLCFFVAPPSLVFLSVSLTFTWALDLALVAPLPPLVSNFFPLSQLSPTGLEITYNKTWGQ